MVKDQCERFGFMTHGGDECLGDEGRGRKGRGKKNQEQERSAGLWR